MVNIAAIADDNYAQHLGTMLTSLLENMKEKCRMNTKVFIIDGGMSEKNIEKMNKVGEKYGIDFDYKYIPDEQYNGLSLRKEINAAIYFKVSIPELIQEDKVLYLVSDAIVLDDVSELWETDISDYYIAACADFCEFAKKMYNIEKGEYFNAGFMLINNKKWRNNNIPTKIRNWLSKYHEYVVSHDQDAFNVAFHEKWLKLHPRWNIISPFFFGARAYARRLGFSEKDLNDILANPALIHFTTCRGLSRPWIYWSRHPYKNEYYKYLRKTPWKSFTPTDKSIITLLRFLRRRTIPPLIRKQLGRNN